MILNFKVVALSHIVTPVEIRERLSLNETACKKIMHRIKEFTDISELLILSTCNRTEIYYTSDKDCSKEIITLIGIDKGIVDISNYFFYFDNITDHEKAVKHLFEVSMGLKSQIVGDNQIITQVKQAYQWSADVSMAGPFLHRLLHTIFFTNKKVIQTTSFRDGAASVSYAAVELAESLCTDIDHPKIVVIGLGEMGTDVCMHLSKASFKQVTLVNRTIAKAEDIAQSLGFHVIPFENMWQAIQDADVIIGSLSKEEPVITKEKVQQLNLLSYKYFIDISVPRSVEPEVDMVHGAMVYNIDHISSRTTAVLQKRMEAIPLVKEIIQESMEAFYDWSSEMTVSPVINKFKNALEEIRLRELERHLKNFDTEDLARIELITKNMMQKIIKLPVLQLKAACKRGEPEALIEVLNELFDLENQSAEIKVKE